MTTQTLLAVPNLSEGRDRAAIAAIGEAFAAQVGVRVLDRHTDGDHHRTVFTLTGHPGALGDALLGGAKAAVERIDIGDGRGAHPHVGAIDVVPVVYLQDGARGAACAQALVVADRIGAELDVPVFLYGALGAGRTRAQLRRGGAARLAERMRSGELWPDFGPSSAHPGAGATLVAAREPLVAFNLQLAAPATLQDARTIAALIREGGAEGLPGLRAIGVALDGAVAQVSMNVERPLELPLARVVQAVSRHAAIASAELVGLAPRAALEGFPEELELLGFDPAIHVIENALGF
jgi:glutamate formiminotransferase/glutamate formiminotransferase/formiminotetrahydrofolate cyclodeaminase